MNRYDTVLRSWMSDFKTTKALFTPKVKVNSPFLGEVPAEQFFDQLANSTSESNITPIDIFLSGSRKNHATAYFHCNLTLRDGTQISFKVMGLFTFEPNTDLVKYLDLIYDTHPIRYNVGNKYE